MKFLTEPALLLDNNTVVVTDLHIGIEHEIYKKGITVPSQLERIKDKLDKIIKQTKAKHLIFLGDIKHQVPSISVQEYREIPKFFEHFSKIKMSIVKGNHDGGIEKIVPSKVDIYEPKGLRLGDFLLTHGQAWPDKEDLSAKYIVMGHVHPAVEFWTDNFRAVEPCWLTCDVDKKILKKKFKVDSKLERGIIMPSFNHLIGGMAFNSEKFKPIGPLLKNNILKWKKSEVYLLDGTFIGKVSDLKS
ncbi:MAG: metallophosphoesterase [Candidatus Aenigmarchaeota archaeon]|nr:metallophosphoesterase [Candidatus Aenigmarchaeota archaeon]